MFKLFLALVILVSCARSADETQLPEVVDFNEHIRPILSNSCFVCHGPDISTREAGLRLDEESFAKSKSGSGTFPVYPGKPQKSEIVRRITSDNPEEMMPPPSSNRTLTTNQIALLTRWIEQGAIWKPHWAFIAPQSSAIEDSSLHPVDYFIAKKYRQKGLKSAERANDPSLMRRLAFTLTGLPPAKEDLDRLLHEESDYRNYVDQLLDSPQYGERWARHWMDLCRYAEGRGHEFDYPVIGAHHYRDYLIRAFNSDLSYFDFIKEQLAGDLLEKPRLHPEKGFNESVIGTLFLNLGEGKHSPVDTKEEEKIRIDNIIDVTSKSFLGLTVACSRCHDHKFDNIPTTDYYSLYGIFESSRVHIYPSALPVKVHSIIDSLDQLRDFMLSIFMPEKKSSINFPVTAPHEKDYVLGDFRSGSYGSWTSQGISFGKKPLLRNVVIHPVAREALITENYLASSRIYGYGITGALRSSTFIIDREYLHFRAAGSGSTIRIVMDNHQLIQDPIHGQFSIKVNDKDFKVYSSYVGQWKGNKAYIEILPGRYYARQGKGHYFRQDTTDWIELDLVLASDSLKSAQNWIDAQNRPPQRNVKLEKTKWVKLHQKWTQFSRSLRDTCYIAGITEGDHLKSPVFIRGDHRELSPEPVPHRFLTAIPHLNEGFQKTGSNRLALAEAIASPQNPLTARVMVNRIWHHLFGKGLVATVDNFGLQGGLPSNPELLDHLAIYFIEHRGSIKNLIRYIVTSSTFQQSTKFPAGNEHIDPDNIYLHHYPVRRLEAESIRDAVLATSGRLDLTMYGPSVPPYLTEFMQGRGRPSIGGPLDGEGRRSIYQALWRNFLPPFMLTFDMPIPFSTFGDRSETNVPAQSLTLLNDPFIREQANLWAQRLLRETVEEKDRITSAYLDAFSRHPSKEEIKLAQEFLQEQRLVSPGIGVDREVTAWSDFCHSLINMKEFIYLI